jgi:HrpA-like RNA helicase
VIYLDEPVSSYVDAAVNKVINIHYTEKPGDVLLFLTGED